MRSLEAKKVLIGTCVICAGLVMYVLASKMYVSITTPEPVRDWKHLTKSDVGRLPETPVSSEFSPNDTLIVVQET